jgi:hypothetical protein
MLVLLLIYCTLTLQVNKHGTLFKGSLVAGAVCIAIAAWVPFAYLDDMISAGVLLCFNAANSSLLVSTKYYMSLSAHCTVLQFMNV